MREKKKNILILGGGVCGLIAAKNLAKKFTRHPDTAKEYLIILINNTDVHVYHSDLYEISTAYNEKITAACLSALEDSVCITLHEVLEELGVDFIQDTVRDINTTKKTVSLRKGDPVSYEYLIVAVGSITNYYNIPGLEENALPLKTLANALALNCHVDQFFRERWEKKESGEVHIVVGGGGATGVEYTCELIGYIRKLSRKYDFDPDKVEISIIDGSPEFVGLGTKASDIVKRRFRQLGINAIPSTYIQGYEHNEIKVEDKESKKQYAIPADIVIWTGGIKPNPLLKSFDRLTKNGEMEVKTTLETPHYPKVYAGGDNAAVIDPKTNKPTPKMGQFALQEGEIIADNIWADMTGGEKRDFHPFVKGFLVPLGGTCHMFIRGGLVFAGFMPYLMKKVHDITYFALYMPLKTAVSRIFHKERIFRQND